MDHMPQHKPHICYKHRNIRLLKGAAFLKSRFGCQS